MYYNHRNLPSNLKSKELWAFDYATNGTEKSMGLKAKPYKCVIKQEYGRDYVYALDKNDKPLKSKSVQTSSRHYAETYEEAIEGYNKLVDKQIDFLIMMAKKHNDDKIVVEEVNNEI